MTTTITNFPTLTRSPSGAEFRLIGNTQAHRSPLDGTTQTIEMPGAQWEVTLTWTSLEETDWRRMAAFLALMQGRSGRCYLSPTMWAPRRSSNAGTPLIDGALQTGTTLNTKGWVTGSECLLAGDWLSYTDTSDRIRLHQVSFNADADGDGKSAVKIMPPIRRAGADEAAVNVTTPTGIWMLRRDEPAPIRLRPPRLADVTLELIEALA